LSVIQQLQGPTSLGLMLVGLRGSHLKSSLKIQESSGSWGQSQRKNQISEYLVSATESSFEVSVCIVEIMTPSYAMFLNNI